MFNVVLAFLLCLAALTTSVAGPGIVTQPQSRTNVVGTEATLSVEATNSAPLAYQWQKYSANLADRTNSTLVLTNVKSSDAGSYRVVVTNAGGAVTSAVATLTVWVPPGFTTQPANQIAGVGSNVTFSVVTSGTTPRYHQWRFNEVDLPGKTSTSLIMNNLQLTNSGGYTVVVTNVAGAVTSVVATLTVEPAFSRQWVRVMTDPASTPVGREAPNMVYDEVRGVVVMHGGEKAHQSAADGLSDTWEWNGETWRLVSTNGPQLTGFGMAYDASRGVTVIYGGRTSSGAFVDYTNQFDTWEWGGQTWTRIETGQSHPLTGMGMAYDPLRKKVIRHGGMSDHSVLDQDSTWEWDGVSWTQIADGFPHAEGCLIHDTNRRTMALFGGVGTSTSDLTRDIWEFNGVAWAPVPAPGPAGRLFTGFVFDSRRGVGVLYGGAIDPSSTPFNDTWEWDGAQWTKMNVAGPGNRSLHAMAYDSKRRKVVMFGGSRSIHQEPYLNDTWEYGLVPLRITAIARDTNNAIVIQWSGEAPPYQLQSRSKLSEGDWQNVGALTDQLSATVPGDSPSRFFRVRQL